MSKRTSSAATGEEGDEQHPQKRSTITDTDEDAIFTKYLAREIFSGRPTQIEKRALHYVAQMRLAPAPKPDDFIAHIKGVYPHAKSFTIAWIWKQLKGYFYGAEDSDYSSIEALASVPEFITAFKAAPHIGEEGLAADEADKEGASGTSTPSIVASRVSTRTRSSRQSSLSSSSSLGPAALLSMRTEFDENFDAFVGEPWTLPSGASLDNILAPHIRKLTKESALHSFMVEDLTGLFRLVNDNSDKAELQVVLVQREGERLRELSKIEESYLDLFDKRPDEVEELLDNGWKNVAPSPEMLELPDAEFRKNVDFVLCYIYKAYEQVAFRLPNSQSESWYLRKVWGFLDHFLDTKGILDYQPGEVCLQASAWRKNKSRSLESKQVLGRKIDGIVSSSATRLELCVLEAARIDNGPTGTKALTDTRRMSKSMKDMFDFIRSRSSVNIRDQLTTFGIRISASTVSFYTLRQRRGRFYQLSCDACVALPPMWISSGGNTASILTVLSLLLRFKAQMMDMADRVTDWTKRAVLVPDATSNGDTWAPTLTTPPSSPRLSPTM